MKKKPITGNCGKRLANLRKINGLTQKELGELVGVSNRVIAYYEKETNYPPSHLLIPLAKALSTTTDELLGLKLSDSKESKPDLKIARRIKKIQDLPPSQRKTLMKTIDTFIKAAEK